MDVTISEIIALIGVIIYSSATVFPDIWGAISGKGKSAAK